MGPRQFKIASFTFVCILLFISKSNAQFMQDERHIEVSLRMIGHHVLLSSGDSISRILPIKKEDDRYRIQFESEFEFKTIRGIKNPRYEYNILAGEEHEWRPCKSD